MGCDIHSAVEVKKAGKWEMVTDHLFPLDFEWMGNTHTTEPFSWRSYGMFAFLADVRNYSHIPPIQGTRGLPDDQVSFDEQCRHDYYHSWSWLSLKELVDFDYSQTFEDRRCMRDGDGAADSGPGNGVVYTFRDFLGPHFFRDIDLMCGLDTNPENIRIVFGFDN